MRLSILSSRDTVPNVVFTMSFNVTFGPPSRVYCVYIRKGQTTKTAFLNTRVDNTQLSRKVIRSQYVSSSQPDMTRVTVKVDQPREQRTYQCDVTVEGRVHIVGIANYAHDTKGTDITNVTVTGERLMFAVPIVHCYTCLLLLLSSSCKHSHWCHYQQDWLHLCPGLLDCPITTTSWL